MSVFCIGDELMGIAEMPTDEKYPHYKTWTISISADCPKLHGLILHPFWAARTARTTFFPLLCPLKTNRI
jgi:hypothetical protein